jgi:hypothetical protein
VVGFDIYRNGVRILKSELREGVRFLGNERCFFQIRVLFHMRGLKGSCGWIK